MDEKIDLQTNTALTQESSKEYTSEKGEKIIVYKNELDAHSLKNMYPSRLEVIANIEEFRTKELCVNCKFWNVIDERKGIKGIIPINGECRVNAPEKWINYVEDKNESPFPLISPFQWCGKYEKLS